MKFRRYITAICSSALVLGLSFLFYPGIVKKTTTSYTPTPELTSTVTPEPTNTPKPTVPTQTPVTNVATKEPTPSPIPTSAPTSKPEPTLPPSLVENRLLKPGYDESDTVTAYINAYYSNDFDTLSTLVTDPALLNQDTIKQDCEKGSKVKDIQLYSKMGTDGVFSVIYATYSLYNNDLQLYIPQFKEYYITRLPDGTKLIRTEPLTEKASEAFLQARRSEAVQALAVPALIQQYHCACLYADETRFKHCVSNTEYLPMEYITSRYSVTEAFENYDFLLYPGINEVDYIVFVTHAEKIIFSETPAPCMESYFISLDSDTGLPAIYLGITSLDTDAYYAALIKNEVIQELAQQTNKKMQDALLSDDDLEDFYNLMRSSSDTQ
ncbi:MAG: hypothetical protein IKB07_12455 [Lachnospiraceae bacterium]|nr:hypothetical protein [Lachnospiraceae bacterium]